MPDPEDQDYDAFGGFGGFGRKRAYFPPLPEDGYLLGENPSGSYVPFLLDGDERLILKVATRIYYPFTIEKIIQASIGVILEPPSDGITKNAIGIDIINVTASPVTCTLYWSEGPTPTASEIFGICGGSIAANTLWSWRGSLYLETRGLWAQAGTANALYAHVSLAALENVYR